MDIETEIETTLLKVNTIFLTSYKESVLEAY